MKNLKCKIGATVLTPLCVGGIAGIIAGLIWILKRIEIIGFIFAGFGVLLFIALIWYGLYEHCIDYQEKTTKKGD